MNTTYAFGPAYTIDGIIYVQVSHFGPGTSGGISSKVIHPTPEIAEVLDKMRAKKIAHDAGMKSLELDFQALCIKEAKREYDS